MIVKNEAHLIVNTFKHLARYIKFDYWAINDNGSTDGTQDLIRNYFAEAGIPGILDETPWRDFAYNRTIAFQAAFGKTDYAFVWDADDEIAGDFKLPANLSADSYLFTYGNAGGTRYSRCQLFNNSLRWKYVGVLHEFPAADETPGEAPRTQDRVDGNYFFISGRTGARNRDPDKYLKDALILEAAFNEAVEQKDGLQHRYAFYTAQSYTSCGRHEKAIEYYKKVLALDNWAQEKYISCLEIYDQYVALKREDEGLPYLVESFRYDSKRIECMYRLVKYYCIKGMPEVSMAYYTLIQQYFENEYATDNIASRLFAKKEEYDLYLPYYMIIVSERLKRFDVFKKMYEMIFRQCYLHAGAWWIHNLFFNLQFGIPRQDPAFVEAMLVYVEKLKRQGITLNNDHYEILDRVIVASRASLTAPIQVPPRPNRPIRVMLTITTCKRLALFKDTMNSMIRTWRDLSSVDYFFCVDDNSSTEDRQIMQAEYPFFDYYMKEPAEKGHRESMNVIWNKLREIQPTYWIHMEDDWLYFKQESYVSRGIALLEKYEEQNIHQLVFNREYGLMLKDMNRTSGAPLEPGIWLHTQTNVEGPNCAYWPHYSIQPSIIRTQKILELGNYDSPNTFFERDYANKYAAAGYKTMFFDSIYSFHIGKQHWEKEGMNAYALNAVGQFIGPSNPQLIISEIPKNEPLQGTMAEHLDQIIAKITATLPFGLIRPSDGEHAILNNTTLTNCDHWTFTTGGRLQQQLMSAIQTTDQNLYVGIPCNTCNAAWNCTQTIYDDFTLRWKVPVAQRTYANLFMTYDGWSKFIAMLRSLKNGFYVITSGTHESDLPIKERFLIDAQLVNRWDLSGESETERLLQFIGDKSGQLICFSAGPLSKYWIPQCMKLNPNNMYIDVGAALDTFTKGHTNRMYTTPTSRFANSPCQFYPLNADLQPHAHCANRNLVYASVFFNTGYFELLRLLMQSIKFFSKTDNIDFLVMTSPEFVPHINALSATLKIPINIHLLQVSSAHEASCARLHIFNYEHIASYEKILYIDTDIIVQNDIQSLFAIDLENKLYALQESTIDKECWGGWFFGPDADRSTPAFNAGILLFKNTPLIRILFADINAHIATMRASNATLPDCYDQPFINYHTIKNNLQETSLLQQYVVLMMQSPPPPPSGPTAIIFYHFAWPLGNADSKKQRMIRHLNHIFDNYNAIYGSSATTKSLVDKKFAWNRRDMLHFQETTLTTTMGANGTYKFLDPRTVCATWSGADYYLRMNGDFTEYVAIRKDNYVCSIGEVIPKKNLVYFSVFHNRDYFRLADLLMKSLRLYSSTDAFDVLVLTSPDFAKEVSALGAMFVHYLPLTTIFEAACARLQIFTYPHIAQYDKILYLDTDIIIKKNLAPMFNLDIGDLLYGIESGTIESPSFGSQFFGDTVDKTTTGINSGTLLFKNCSAIQSLFERIRLHINTFTGAPPYCMDQPFINYHAIKDRLYDNQLLKPLVSLYEDKEIPTNVATSTICHFSFPIGDAGHKYERMATFFRDILTAVEGGVEPISVQGRSYVWDIHGGWIKFCADGILETRWGRGVYYQIGANRVRADWNHHFHVLTFSTNSCTSIRIQPLDFSELVLV